MGSEAGDEQQRHALARAMAAALQQRSLAHTHESSRLPPGAPTNALDNTTKSQQWPLLGSKNLRYGVQAQVGNETTDDDSKHDQARCASVSEESDNALPTRKRACSSDATVELALALLRQLQQDVECSGAGAAAVSKEHVDQILAGFAKALETSASSKRAVEDEMQRLFLSHTNVFDTRMQRYFLENYVHEAECARTLRAAKRRTSLVRRCLVAMYPTGVCSGDSSALRGAASASATPRRWSTSLVANAVEQQQDDDSAVSSQSIDACVDVVVVDPTVLDAVKRQLQKLTEWDFDVFAIADAAPGQTLRVVGSALLAAYDFALHFRTTNDHVQRFLHQVELKYFDHPYHNALHAADVAQSLHHMLAVGGLGATMAPRTKCAAIVAAIVHDVGHTGYSNNFHTSANDDLAVRYAYRSPLEHMHCALAFELLQQPQCNVLDGLTKIEQLEVRSLITDMVLATDNAVHSPYLTKLEALVRRSTTNDSWRLNDDPDDEKLVLQMALHAADVSNPAKATATSKRWAARILTEFYQQGDQERALQLRMSVGCDRNHPIDVAQLQAGFILGIVRPLFATLAQLPRVQLAHCVAQLDANVSYWQQKLAKNKSECDTHKSE